MDIRNIQPGQQIVNYKNKVQQNITQPQFKSDKQINSISNFPKSYIKFTPAFMGGDLEDRRKMEQLDREDQDIKDYLWAKGWSELTATKNAFAQYDAECDYATAKQWFDRPLSDKKRKKLYDKCFGQIEIDKAKREEILKNSDYYEKLLQKRIIKRPLSVTEIMANSKGSLETKIAGYSALKNKLNYSFIAPIRKEAIEGGEENVLNSILLCGPTGCGKTIAAEAVANETKCNVVRIPTGTNTDKFAEKVGGILEDSRDYYYTTLAKNQEIKNSKEFQNLSEEEQKKKLLELPSPRTVVIVDEIDRYFNPMITKESAIKTNNMVLKSTLENCSKKPTKENPVGYATTFIFTTNYPSRVLGSNSKTDINPAKCSPFAVLPPANKDMEDVIRHYLRIGNKIIDEQQKNGNDKIKKIDVEKINLSKFVEKYGPSEKNGAYSNDAIAHIIPDAVKLYIEEPDKGFNMAFLRAFKYSMKDITPEKLALYSKQLAELGIDKPASKPIDSSLSEKEQLKEKIKRLEEFKTKDPDKWTQQMEGRLQKARDKYDSMQD